MKGLAPDEMEPGRASLKQASDERGYISRGLGPVLGGLVAASLVILTLLVAVLLGTQEESLVAVARPTETETLPPASDRRELSGERRSGHGHNSLCARRRNPPSLYPIHAYERPSVLPPHSHKPSKRDQDTYLYAQANVDVHHDRHRDLDGHTGFHWHDDGGADRHVHRRADTWHDNAGYTNQHYFA